MRSKRDAKLLDEIDGVVFEADVVRGWIKDLYKRAKDTQERLKTKPPDITGVTEVAAELQDAMQRLARAEKSLQFFEQAVYRREHPE